MCQHTRDVRTDHRRVPCATRAPDPAQARGVLVLPVPVATVRPVGQPAVLDHGDARPRARRGRGSTTARSHGRRRRRHRFLLRGHRRHVDAANLTLLDQSPHQLARARRKPALQGATVVQGDAERPPLPDRHFDRWVSCGSIEYWPDPQAAIAEAYRVVKPGGSALLVGPLPPGARSPGCSPTSGCSSRRRRTTAAGCAGRASRTSRSPTSRRTGRAAPYGIAIAGASPRPAPHPPPRRRASPCGDA